LFILFKKGGQKALTLA
jgi:hypothetical protein